MSSFRTRPGSRAFILGVTTLALWAGAGVRLAAQDDEGGAADPAELMRQIRRNMSRIEEEFSKLGPASTERGEQVRKDIERLLEGLQKRQGQVVKDIDDVIKQLKKSDSSSSSGGGGGKSDSQQNQKNSQARDRNKPQKPQDGKQKGQKKDQQGKEQKDGGKEDNSQKERDAGKNTNTKQPPPPARLEKVAHPDLNEIWGNLPKELRQKLVDRNFDDFTPEYENEVQEYFRRTNVVKKP